MPIAIRLTPAFARSRSTLGDLLARAAGPRARGAEPEWRLSSREWRFAQAMLVRHTRLWLWRTDPTARAGDFVVVDMSSPWPQRRPVWVLDLKCQAPLKHGGGGAGISLSRADDAVAWLAEAGLTAETPARRITGDGLAILELWEGLRRSAA